MPLPHEKSFRRMLAASLPPSTVERIIRAGGERYTDLRAAHPGIQAQARLEKQVLPILALYQTLVNDEGLKQSEALDLLQPALLETYFGSLRHSLLLFNQWIAHLPVQPFALLRPVVRRMCMTAEGTHPVIIEDSAQKLIIHSRRCPVLDALRALGAPELTALFCASDDWLASAMPRIRWLRSTTLARGGEWCDFHWERG